MSFTHNVAHTYSSATRNITASKAYTREAELPELDAVIPLDSTDYEVLVAIDFSQVKTIVIVSDQQLKLETNDARNDTIQLEANVPYIWTEDSYDTLKITVDVTKFVLTSGTSGTGAAARLQMAGLYDPTA